MTQTPGQPHGDWQAVLGDAAYHTTGRTLDSARPETAPRIMTPSRNFALWPRDDNEREQRAYSRPGAHPCRHEKPCFERSSQTTSIERTAPVVPRRLNVPGGSMTDNRTLGQADQSRHRSVFQFTLQIPDRARLHAREAPVVRFGMEQVPSARHRPGVETG